jgi:hypothetical protein
MVSGRLIDRAAAPNDVSEFGVEAMRKMWLLPVLALVAYGADLTGKWTGSIEVYDPSSGSTINTPVKAEFAQHAGVLTGKIGRTEDDEARPIRNAKLEGKKLVFEVEAPDSTGLMTFSLAVVRDDWLEGEMKGAVDVGDITGKVKLGKVK